MRTLIKNGTIVTAVDLYRGDVLDRGREDRGHRLSFDVPADKTIDAAGKLVLPGGIDVHTHLDMPFGGSKSADDFETGTIAAAFGGTTSIVDFAIQYRGQALQHALDTWKGKADGKAAIDYGFHMIVTEVNDQIEAEMDTLVRDGVTSFKLFMAYPGVFMLDDASIFKALLRPGRTAARSACTPRTAASSTSSCSARWPKARRRRSITRSRVRRGPRARRRTAPLRWRKSPTSRSTSSICRPPRRSRW